jgi:outer membrane lipoprotein-sorting protein
MKKLSKYVCFGLALFIVPLFSSASAAGGNNAFGMSDLDLLKKADSLASYYGTDSSAQYTIVQDKPGQKRSTTVAGVFRRDSMDTYVIIIMEPDVSKGEGYLKQGKTLWIYDPESKRFESTSSAARFQNTNARNSDFTRSTLAVDYNITGGADGRLGRFKCRILELVGKTDDLTYPKMKIWISEDGLVRKAEDYSLSGMLMRTMAIPDYQHVDGRYVPRSVLFVDANLGATINGKFVNEKTQITITNPAFTKRPDSIYSKAYLQSVSQ